MIVLMPNCAFLSETSRMVAIAQALLRAGAPVTLATHGGPFIGVLDAAGLPYRVLPPVLDQARSEQYVRDVVAIGRPGLRLQSAEEVRAGVTAETAFLGEVGARMVVIGFTLTAYLSSRLAGVPLATSHGGSFVPAVFERRLIGTPTQAPAPQLDRLPGPLLRLQANLGAPRMRGPVAFLNEVADELGVERVPSLAALMVGDLTLVTDAPQVLGIPADELAAWRPRGRAYRPSTRLVYTGPLFAQLDLPVPERVEAFLDQRRGRPTAYVALSSSTPELTRTAVAGAVAAGLGVVVATPHPMSDLEGPDVVVEGRLPSHRVMPRVDVAVVTGGQGSVQTAMATGTPFVGLPLQPEQEFNVSLGVRHGAAVGVGPRRATPERVAAAVHAVLGDPRKREAATRLKETYAAWDGPDAAARAILDHLAVTPA